MTADRTAGYRQAPGRSAPSQQALWFAGLTRNGIVLVVIACAANAVRPFLRIASLGDGWPLFIVQRFGTTLTLMSVTLLPVVATVNRVPPESRWRYPTLTLAALLATAAGMTIVGLIDARGWTGWLEEVSRTGGFGWWFYLALLRYGVIVLMFAAVFVFYRLREEHEAATRQAELDRVRSMQQMDEARLQMLQAQIEPHFLFNTLANVRRLYQTDPSAAEATLHNLMRYLSVALPQMRATDSTLGREAALVESYLEIQRIRMGRRLAYEIAVPERLRSASVPPMMLITLVENAIKHGISPLPEGGFVRVGADVEDGRLLLQVADSGQGFTRTSGVGTGLANIRARLAGMYGRAGELTLGLNRPRGVTATIVLPYPATSRGPAG